MIERTRKPLLSEHPTIRCGTHPDRPAVTTMFVREQQITAPVCLDCADSVMRVAGSIVPEAERETGWARWLEDTAHLRGGK